MFLHLIYVLQTWTKQEQKHDLFCGLYQLLFSSFTRSPSRVSVSEETSPNLFHSMNSSVLAALNISLRRSASRRRLRLRRRARYKLALKSLNGPQVAFQMIVFKWEAEKTRTELWKEFMLRDHSQVIKAKFYAMWPPFPLSVTNSCNLP